MYKFVNVVQLSLNWSIHVCVNFTNSGAAVEFRVAAVNQFGTGPYTCCTPNPELSSMMFYIVTN